MSESKKVLIALCLFFLIHSVPAAGQNVLKDPGFEAPIDSWSLWGSEKTDFGRTGKFGLMIHNEDPKWSGADQKIALPSEAKQIEVKGWMKTEKVVPGSNPWEMARISVEFYNEEGQLTGGYPPVTGQTFGTNEWKEYQLRYPVPNGATQVKLQCAIGNAAGTAWFDDLSLHIYNQAGTPLSRKEFTGPVDEGEWYEIRVNPTFSGSHYVDWSSLLDAPAGKHGFLKVVDGHFQFEDGTAAKFWGTNLVAGSCFPSKAVADSMAGRMSKMGINLVRLHHMDAPWANPNIFGGPSNAANLNAESLDKLDYLIYALKKKGIYIFMDLLVHRDFSLIEEVKNKPPDLGGKQVAYFDPILIKWQKDYARQLLTHKNPYTKLSYNEEPAIVASEFINESTAFLHFGGDILTENYRKELERKFQTRYPGKKLSVFDLDYEKGHSPRVKEKAETKGDVKESIQFFSEVERKYYKEMAEELKKKMGIRYPLAGSNFPLPVLAYQRNNTALDFIITNDYWDHPQLWKTGNDWSRILYAPIHNLSMIRNPHMSILSNNAKYKWNNMPMIVTEYHACYPNEYVLEAAPLIASYAALQGTDGMLQFHWDELVPGEDRMNSFSLSRSPDQLAQWVVASPLFLRGDIKMASGLVLDPISEEEVTALPLYSDFLDTHYYLPFVTRVAKSFKNEKADDINKYDSFYSKEDKLIKSETGELKLDSKNAYFELQSAKVQGIIGDFRGKTFELPFMKIKINNSWASVIVVSKDGKPLNESNNFYLVVTAPTKMSGQKFNDSRSGLVDTGELPLLAQVIDGEVIFNKDISKAVITPLNLDGTKGTTIKPNGNILNLKSGRTFVYELLLK